MFVSNTFVCDLRRSDGDKIQASIMAKNLAEAIWEHFLFVLSARVDGTSREERSVSLSLFVIDADSQLHILLPTDDFSIRTVQKALNSFIVAEYGEPVEIGEKDPLAAALDYASYGNNHSVFVFISDSFEWIDPLETTIKRIEVAGSDLELSFAILSSEERPSTVLERLLEIQHINAFHVMNRDDVIFEFFRNATNRVVVNRTKETLLVNEHRIECVAMPLFLGDSRLDTCDVCRCHKMPVKTKVITDCPISGKHVRDTMRHYSLGPFLLDVNDPQEENRLHCRYTIDSCRVSESLLFGVSRYLQSSSAVFYRMITEMRCHKQAIIAQKLPTLVVGGEFWLLVADPLAPVIHCKRIANRAQILRFDVTSDLPQPSEVYTTPVLPLLAHVESVNPFELGREHISMWLH